MGTLETICCHTGRTFSCVVEHCCCHGSVIRPLSARNVEYILLLEFSLPYFIEYSLYVIFFHGKYFAKELRCNAFCSTEYLAQVC